MSATAKLPDNLELLHDIQDPNDPARPSRLCVCISDVHFTDGTVGNQSAEEPVWETFFNQLESTCILHAIEEVTLVLDGDIVDMIRTSQWATARNGAGFYPWQAESGNPEDKAEFSRVVQGIMNRITQIHATLPDPNECDEHGENAHCHFFGLLKQLPERLKGKGPDGTDITVKTLALLGNHDKEILADDAALKTFYEECLGQNVEGLSEDYRRWVGRQYGDENMFLATESVPWLPFYHGDRGFRLFLTHGQWRDSDNSRPVANWKAGDGWQLKLWQDTRFQPFRASCFGDTVAAGMLSTFIHNAKEGLKKLPPAPEVEKLNKILDELDLYRPTYAAIERVLIETRDMRKEGKGSAATKIIEDNLYDAVKLWLGFDFTIKTAPGMLLGPVLRLARLLLKILGVFSGHRVELEMIYWLSKFLARFQSFTGYDPDSKISYKDMLAFPCFLPAYRDLGFHVHGEGHTHVALQEELYFNTPPDNKNYTYINFGTWRDQIVKKQKHGYRRRGIGRALVVLDLKPKEAGDPRRFAYYVQDAMSWGDHLDRF